MEKSRGMGAEGTEGVAARGAETGKMGLQGETGLGTDEGRPRGAGRAEAGREQTAERLLRSTAVRSYDPELEVDWSAPPVPGLRYMLDERCSLYGTALWRSLSPEQQLELGKHE